MTSKDRDKIEAFIDYAMDHEGMEYKAHMTTSGKWSAVPMGNYDKQVMAAVERNFKQEWKAFVGD